MLPFIPILVGIAAKKLGEHLSRNRTPVCAVPGCGCSADQHTNCCGTQLCPAHIREWDRHFPGRCPVGGCGKYMT